MSIPDIKKNDWYDYTRAEEVIEAYNRGGGSALPADKFVAQSVVPAGTGAYRDFSYIAPEVPELTAENCVACMECVQNCPDTAILGKVVRPEDLEKALAAIADEDQRALARAQFVQTTKFFKTYQKKHDKDPAAAPGAEFGIFIDPTKCKGCGECVEVCGDHGALKMIKKTPDNLPDFFALWKLHNDLPATPKEYISEKISVDLMLKPSSLQYVGGAGSCMGCGEASVIRQIQAITNEYHGNNYGIIAATGCSTVYGSTYPYNPFTVPWSNSLFENAATFAMGVRRYWDDMGLTDRGLWAMGGDGGMLDIGFQALSRLLCSGMNVKVFIMDTQVYSNTGGQTSCASYMGQEAKMSVHGKTVPGKPERRKEAAQICMMHPNTYVAQTIGPMTTHFYKSLRGALEYQGPAVIMAYTTCQPEHGVADDLAAHQARLAVETRAFPILIYDPSKGRTIKERLSLQGNPSVNRNWHTKELKDGTVEVHDFCTFARSEGRFAKHFAKDGSPSAMILASQQERLENWWQLQELAGVVNKDLEEEGA
jgi:pyruvate/2-oxoacid:ferredoxin oxidoreductase beta subunit/Pyruvate/2-oxoacid:ferredoxin oxidoreductase delta subunit